MDPHAKRIPTSLLAVALMASVGCHDRVAPTDPALDVVSTAAKVRLTPSIASVTLNSTTLNIGGPSVGYTVTVDNPGKTLKNVSLQGEIVQGTAIRGAGGFSVNCPPNALGTLPTGSCTMQFTTIASNTTGGGGTLVEGTASFVLTLFQVVGQKQTTLDTRTITVTLSAEPRITDLVLASTQLTINGANVDYTATLNNPGPPLSGLQVFGELTQGSTVRGAGAVLLRCDPNDIGALPTGVCTVQWSARAVNDPEGYGNGPLLPGPATFVLSLMQDQGGTLTPLDATTADVTLVVAKPLSIISLDLDLVALVVGSPENGYTAHVYNSTGIAQSNLALQAYIEQNGNVIAAGGTAAGCPSAGFPLPPGDCTISYPFNVPADAGLVDGQQAIFRLELWQGTTMLDSRSLTLPVMVISP